VFCHSGVRSGRAAEFLRSAGFRKSRMWPAASMRGPKRSIRMFRVIKHFLIPAPALAPNPALMLLKIRAGAELGGRALVLLISLGGMAVAIA